MRQFYMMFSNRDAMRLQSGEKKQDALRLESLPIQKPPISSGESQFINLRPELTWTHYRLLLRVENDKALQGVWVAG